MVRQIDPRRNGRMSRTGEHFDDVRDRLPGQTGQRGLGRSGVQNIQASIFFPGIIVTSLQPGAPGQSRAQTQDRGGGRDYEEGSPPREFDDDEDWERESEHHSRVREDDDHGHRDRHHEGSRHGGDLDRANAIGGRLTAMQTWEDFKDCARDGDVPGMSASAEVLGRSGYRVPEDKNSGDIVFKDPNGRVIEVLWGNERADLRDGGSSQGLPRGERESGSDLFEAGGRDHGPRGGDRRSSGNSFPAGGRRPGTARGGTRRPHDLDLHDLECDIRFRGVCDRGCITDVPEYEYQSEEDDFEDEYPQRRIGFR